MAAQKGYFNGKLRERQISGNSSALFPPKIILTIDNHSNSDIKYPCNAMGPMTAFAEMAEGIIRDPGCLDTGDGDAKDKQRDPGKVSVRTQGLHLSFELLDDHIADAGEKKDGAYPHEGAVPGTEDMEADNIPDGQQRQVDKYQYYE